MDKHGIYEYSATSFYPKQIRRNQILFLVAILTRYIILFQSCLVIIAPNESQEHKPRIKCMLTKICEFISSLGLTQWNQNSFEFKFDDTRLCSWYKNKIDPIEFFLLRPDVAKSLLCWLFQFSFSKLRHPTGQRQSNIRTQQKNFNQANLILILWGKSGIIKFEFNTT